ncbi:hypothetical protein U8P73_36740 (plasmid) [Rhizobium beringeri]|uniref:hypothetical protein n=1 Tax=Rhizobium beringeri TaxID=3019934 RepID=UPI002DDCD084|nr:hypothetical protein [Rhizobium beringeri]WSG93521.1 hypothetical protein U8P73_36740 [Rhizobium beringeri]
MKLWIPDIGDKIILTADWTFSVINEGRNAAIWQALDLEKHPDVVTWHAENAATRKCKRKPGLWAARISSGTKRTRATASEWSGSRLYLELLILHP